MTFGHGALHGRVLHWRHDAFVLLDRDLANGRHLRDRARLGGDGKRDGFGDVQSTVQLPVDPQLDNGLGNLDDERSVVLAEKP